MSSSEKEQELLGDIEIARTDLYVFGDSPEYQKWAKLLDSAEEAVLNNQNYTFAEKLIARVKGVTDNLWKRIFRWQEIQRKVTVVFSIVIPVELIGVILYFSYIAVDNHPLFTSMLFGLIGGSLGVALSIGQGLQVKQSNRLQMMRLLLRPFIGVISAIVLYSLLQTKIVVVAPYVDSTSIIILLSVFAGFSERFIVKALGDYIPRIIGK